MFIFKVIQCLFYSINKKYIQSLYLYSKYNPSNSSRDPGDHSTKMYRGQLNGISEDIMRN